MDFSFVLVMGLSAILASAWMIFAEVSSRRVSFFRVPFITAYLLGLALMQPWNLASVEAVGISAAMLLFVAFWVMIGWILGAVPTALIFSVVRWASGIARKRA
jgi:hypothetical protein